jgi:hypothetical protein
MATELTGVPAGRIGTRRCVDELNRLVVDGDRDHRRSRGQDRHEDPPVFQNLDRERDRHLGAGAPFGLGHLHVHVRLAEREAGRCDGRLLGGLNQLGVDLERDLDASVLRFARPGASDRESGGDDGEGEQSGCGGSHV